MHQWVGKRDPKGQDHPPLLCRRPGAVRARIAVVPCLDPSLHTPSGNTMSRSTRRIGVWLILESV